MVNIDMGYPTAAARMSAHARQRYVHERVKQEHLLHSAEQFERYSRHGRREFEAVIEKNEDNERPHCSQRWSQVDFDIFRH